MSDTLPELSFLATISGVLSPLSELSSLETLSSESDSFLPLVGVCFLVT